ncbi:MAG: cupin domain-containing protein [Planctomycetota bacterium]|jgi:transcriptional regulator with XRE-family HTH domain
MKEKYDFSVIRMLRQRNRWTIKALAEKCGLTYPTVESIETNKTFPTLKTIDGLADALGISASNLLSLCEKVSVLKRPARFLEGPQSAALEGIDVCRIASYGSAKLIRIKAPAGKEVQVMEIHEDVYEFCYVLEGVVELWINEKKHLIQANETVLFDALLEHRYVQIEDGQYMTVHIPKNNATLSSILTSVETESA